MSMGSAFVGIIAQGELFDRQYEPRSPQFSTLLLSGGVRVPLSFPDLGF